MTINSNEWIWHNGEMVPWAEARVHVLSHALHYGSSIFEGIRVYPTPQGSQIFRLAAHTRRLLDSAKIHRIAIPYSAEQIDSACREIILANNLTRLIVLSIQPMLNNSPICLLLVIKCNQDTFISFNIIKMLQ